MANILYDVFGKIFIDWYYTIQIGSNEKLINRRLDVSARVSGNVNL